MTWSKDDRVRIGPTVPTLAGYSGRILDVGTEMLFVVIDGDKDVYGFWPSELEEVGQ